MATNTKRFNIGWVPFMHVIHRTDVIHVLVDTFMMANEVNHLNGSHRFDIFDRKGSSFLLLSCQNTLDPDRVATFMGPVIDMMIQRIEGGQPKL